MDEQNLAPIELSEQELDEVSGGFSLFLSGSMFDQTEALMAQQTTASPLGSSTNFIMRQSRTASSAFQMVGIGFNSAREALPFLFAFARLFGRRR